MSNIINENDYCFGSAESLIMDCPDCNQIHFRSAIPVLYNCHKEFCVYCSSELIPRKKGELHDR